MIPMSARIYQIEYTSRTGGRMLASFTDLQAAISVLRAKKCEARLLDGDGQILGRVTRNDGRIPDRRVRWMLVSAW